MRIVHPCRGHQQWDLGDILFLGLILLIQNYFTMPVFGVCAENVWVVSVIITADFEN